MADSNPVLAGLLRGYQLADQIRMQQQQAQRQEMQQQEIERRRAMEEQDRAESQRVTRRREQIENARNLIELQKAGGFKLTSQQLAQLAGGGDFSVPLGDGIATTASSASRIEMPDGTYLLPQPGDLREAATQREIDDRERMAEAQALPVPPVVAAALGLPEGVKAPASLLDNYMTGFNSISRADQPRTKTAIDPVTGELVELDLESGKRTARPFVNPRPQSVSPSEARLGAKDNVENNTRVTTNNAIADATDEYGNIDWAKARQTVIAAARKDKTIDLAAALRAIRSLEPRASSRGLSGVDPIMAKYLGNVPEFNELLQEDNDLTDEDAGAVIGIEPRRK